jgi:hypothetical protein
VKYPAWAFAPEAVALEDSTPDPDVPGLHRVTVQLGGVVRLARATVDTREAVVVRMGNCDRTVRCRMQTGLGPLIVDVDTDLVPKELREPGARIRVRMIAGAVESITRGEP